MLTGERPEHNSEVAARLARVRARRLHLLCRLGLRAGARARACCRTPTSACSRQARSGAAARRDRISGADARVRQPGSASPIRARRPSTRPARLETIAAAGELKIPFTSGILVGIGETEDQRVEALEALAAQHRAHGHLQEVILQNFVPHQSYYGREPAEIADDAAREYWRTGVGNAPHRDAPDVGVPGERR